MLKHPVRPFVYALLLPLSLAYPLSAFAADLVLKGRAGNNQVTLTWNAVPDANYVLCYAKQAIADVNSCGGGKIVNINAGITRHIVTNLSGGAPYYFQLLAKKAAKTVAVSSSLSALPYRTLNDTGITRCSDPYVNNLACPVEGYPNQDAQLGRDITQNNNSNGHAGFNFTKVSSAGQALSAQATQWQCVQDNVTGLMWEVKTNDNGLHDKDWTYSWYHPDNNKNGGATGVTDGGSCRHTSACDTYAYVNAVNKAGWCGYKNWRLPSKIELDSLVDFGRNNRSIDPAYFPNTVSAWFWSSSSNAKYSGYAWVVNFYGGDDNYRSKNGYDAVRLVRGGQ